MCQPYLEDKAVAARRHRPNKNTVQHLVILFRLWRANIYEFPFKVCIQRGHMRLSAFQLADSCENEGQEGHHAAEGTGTHTEFLAAVGFESMMDCPERSQK